MSDRPDIGEIYDRCAPRIYRYIYHRLGQQALAEDMTSEVFVRFIRARVAPDNLMAYLYRAAHNLIVDYLRQNPALLLPIGEELAAEHSDPAYLAELESERMRLRRAIMRLSPDQQQVIVLRYVEGLSNAEIGRVLDRPEGAIKALQHRAIVNLRNLLGGSAGRQGELEFVGLLK
ncbi:MAG: sigma-70 family RNA polymerase sigma factor [Anaerolineae bacterium]